MIFQTLTLLPDNSYSFHRIVLKLSGQLDYEVVHRILFPGYITLNFDSVITLFNDISDFDLISG